MSQPEVDRLVSNVRSLTAQYKSGGKRAHQPFRELVVMLLGLTVMPPSGGLREHIGPAEDRIVLAGWSDPTDPIPLNNGHHLRISISLYYEFTEKAGFEVLKVRKASWQYQSDKAGDQWIFRYDYLRYPEDEHPQSHLQIRGTLTEDVLPRNQPLERVHFPTGRFSFESVLRLLIDQFGVPSNNPSDIWRPVLAESERAFLEIAHQPLSGPGGEPR